METSLVKIIFFGNLFYGLCAIALSIEALLQQQLHLVDVYFFVASFAVTVFYYTLSYSAESLQLIDNPRTVWYAGNLRLVSSIKWISLSIVIGFCVFLTYRYWNDVLRWPLNTWLVVLIFPAVALMYYGVTYRVKSYSLRSIGWMKPFVIGFVWAGLVTIYPAIYYFLVNDQSWQFTWVGLFLFVKNFMFITVLAIMFDIKDYATDSNLKLKTYVVDKGLRTTIFKILIPLSVAGLGSFLAYGFYRHFSFMRIFLNTIPFFMMLAVAYYLHRRQSIFYYLVLIDGLILVKALCGTLAVTYF